jgi:hypothetical protein
MYYNRGAVFTYLVEPYRRIDGITAERHLAYGEGPRDNAFANMRCTFNLDKAIGRGIFAAADTAEEVLGLCGVAVIGRGDQSPKVEELLDAVRPIP